jgi:hypothetical protein
VDPTATFFMALLSYLTVNKEFEDPDLPLTKEAFILHPLRGIKGSVNQ